MFGNPHFAHIRQMFADQFEQNGPDFLYRRSMKGPPIRVSSDERDHFVESFNRRLRYCGWSIVPATLLLIVALVMMMPDLDGPAGQAAIYVGIALILLPFLAGHRWAWNGPVRELSRRTPEGEALSRDEVKRLMLSKMTYSQLALAVLAAFALLWKISGKTDVLHGWGVVWPALAALLVVATAVQAFRKWRLEHSGSPSATVTRKIL